jgi:arylsulfatase A-like enzyme
MAWGWATGVAAGLLLLVVEMFAVAWGQLAAARALLDPGDFVSGCLTLPVIFAAWGAALGLLAGVVSWSAAFRWPRAGRAWGIATLLLLLLPLFGRDALHAWYPECPWQGPLLFWGLFPLLALLFIFALRPWVVRLARLSSGHPWLGPLTLLPIAIGGYWLLQGRDACGRVDAAIAAAAPAPSNPAKRLPNVILISLDTVRADALGCYGNTQAHTPWLDRLAAEGVRFSNVSAPLPSTRPSHTSMLTGLEPARHKVVENMVSALSRDLPTLAEILAAHGYATGGFVSSEVLTARAGLDQGFDLYDDCFAAGHERLRFMPITPRRLTLLRPTLRGLGGGEVASVRPGSETLGHALRWLEQVRGGPFFLFLHFYDAHAPYDPPEEFARLYLRPGESVAGTPFDAEHVEFWSRMYAAGVAEVDALVGRLLTTLEEDGLAANTLLLITADHGESFADDYYYNHSERVFESVLRVPLLVRYPPLIPPAQVDTRLVSLVDITPTLLDWLDLEAPPLLDGRSLTTPEPVRDELHATSNFRETLGWRPGYVSYRRGQRKWIENVLTHEITEESTRESRLAAEAAADSLASTTASAAPAEVSAELERYIDQVVQQSMSGGVHMEIDQAARDRLRALGYIE